MRNRTANFRIPALVLVPALVFLASCEFPQSARIKASPTFEIPIPLGEGKSNSFIRPYISVEGIQDQLKGNGEGKTIAVYNYKLEETEMTTLGITPEGGNLVQTYLITYPLFDMSLNFGEYINGLDSGASRVPKIEITPQMASVSTFGNGFTLPPLEVDLGDMKNLVSDITLNQSTSFSITVTPANAEEMKSALRIRIPQLKIGGATNTDDSWTEGTIEENKLVFKSSITDNTEPLLLISDESDLQKKKASEKVEVYIKLANKITAGTYDTELDFNWNTVQVKPNETGKQEGEFKGFDLGSYLDNLGIGAEFEKILAYFYLEDPSNTFEGFTVKIKDLVESTNLALDLDKIDGETKPAWSSNATVKKYDFTTVLNGKNVIKYTISPPTKVEIKHEDIGADSPKITATLAVLLPMSFKLSVPDNDPDVKKITINEENYLPIKFEGLDEFLGSDNGGGDNSSVMDEIDKQLGEGGLNSLKLKLSGIKNNVTSPIFLAVNTDKAAEKWELVEITTGNTGEFEIKAKSLNSIPSPKFMVKAGSDKKGRLYIQSAGGGDRGDQPEFDVKISVVADIDLDKPIDL
jgi:hypothetical protein